MTKTRLAGGALLFVIAIAAISLLFRPSDRADPDWDTPKPPDVKGIVRDMEKDGIMSSADNWHFREIRKRTMRDRRITDEDFRWLIAVGRKPSTDGPFVRTMTLDVFGRTRPMSPEQKRILRDEALQWMSSRVVLDRDNAMVVMWIVRDPNTIPRILPLLNDPNQIVRKKAQWALQSMGCELQASTGPS